MIHRRVVEVQVGEGAAEAADGVLVSGAASEVTDAPTARGGSEEVGRVALLGGAAIGARATVTWKKIQLFDSTITLTKNVFFLTQVYNWENENKWFLTDSIYS